jgi:glutaredoxin 2
MMKLYQYDHCPYCVKARMIFGLKQLPVDVVTLLNDDEATPIRMIGVKMVPILEKAAGEYMAESMDIVRYIDGMDDAPLLTRANDPSIATWLMQASAYLYKLAMPRWVQAPLPEFATDAARQYFTHKKEAMIGAFEEVMARGQDYMAQANTQLEVLEGILPQQDTPYGEDDIHLFAVLRSLSIVKGIIYPARIEDYRQRMSQISGVPLYDDIAV